MVTNVINNISEAGGVLCKAAAKIFADEVQFTKSIAQVPASEFDGKNGYKSGSTIYVSKPARFDPQETFDITSTKQDFVEEKVALTLDISSTVGLEFDTTEFATEIDIGNMIQRVIKPAAQSIAQDVERRMLQKATQATYNAVGTAGSTVLDTDTALAAREKMNKFLCPKDDNRFLLIDSTAMRSAVNARKGLFQSSSEISEQYKMGFIGVSDGFKWLENEMLYTHTNGADVSGIAVESSVLVPATGASTLGVDGVASGATIKKGTVFTIAGVYAVHPITKQQLNFLQQFTVTADVTETSGNSVTLAISPTIYSSASGALQNVSALPADEAALTFVGDNSTNAAAGYSNSLAFHKEAFRTVSVPLIMPQNAEFAAQETYQGMTVAIVRAWDNNKRSMVTRLDFLGGLVPVRQEWACRIFA